MQLLVAARKAEAEVSDRKVGTMTIKAKAPTANDELVSLKQQVSDLVAVVKDNHVWENSKKITQQNDQRNDDKSRRAQTFVTNGHFNTTGPLKNNQLTQPFGSPICTTMLSLLEMGPHGKIMCHTFKLLKGGSFSVSSLQNQRHQREQEPQQTQPKQIPSPSKQ